MAVHTASWLALAQILLPLIETIIKMIEAKPKKTAKEKAVVASLKSTKDTLA